MKKLAIAFIAAISFVAIQRAMALEPWHDYYTAKAHKDKAAKRAGSPEASRDAWFAKQRRLTDGVTDPAPGARDVDGRDECPVDSASTQAFRDFWVQLQVTDGFYTPTPVPSTAVAGSGDIAGRKRLAMADHCRRVMGSL